MGTFSIWHWLIVLGIALLLFGGGGKVAKILGDLGTGLKNFKNNIKDAKDSTAKGGTLRGGTAKGGPSRKMKK